MSAVASFQPRTRACAARRRSNGSRVQLSSQAAANHFAGRGLVEPPPIVVGQRRRRLSFAEPQPPGLGQELNLEQAGRREIDAREPFQRPDAAMPLQRSRWPRAYRAGSPPLPSRGERQALRARLPRPLPAHHAGIDEIEQRLLRRPGGPAVSATNWNRTPRRSMTTGVPFSASSRISPKRARASATLRYFMICTSYTIARPLDADRGLHVRQPPAPSSDAAQPATATRAASSRNRAEGRTVVRRRTRSEACLPVA